MSDTMSDAPKPRSRPACFLKAVFRPALFLKVAAAMLVLAGAVSLTYVIAATLPEKDPGWQAALPTATMSEEQADIALLRAEYLHEAAVRPLLVRAGIVSTKDLTVYDDKQGDPFSSGAVLGALWTVRPFPELHASLLAALLDESTAPRNRVTSFYMAGEFLSATAEAIAGKSDRHRISRRDFPRGKPPQKVNWFAYFHNAHEKVRPIEASNENNDRATFSEKYTLAKQVLPLVLAGLQQEMTAKNAQATPPRGPKNRDALAMYLKRASPPVHRAVRLMLRERANPGFSALAREIIASGKGRFIDRYLAVSLIAENPGLQPAEYLFWQRYKRDLDRIAPRAATSHTSWVHRINGGETFMTALTDELKARGTVELGGQTGPGVSMTQVDTLTPPRALSGKLYLLMDGGKALQNAPEYDLDRAYPVFEGRLFRHMAEQPLILPLSPGNPGDAALIAWYAEKGWQQNRTLLFSAVGTPMEVARHWGSVHLIWGPEHQTPAYLRPANGFFMAGLLPQLKGKDATRLLGPITGLWFGRQTVDPTGWLDELYEARPEVMPAPLSARRITLRSPLLERFQLGEAAIQLWAIPVYTEDMATITLLPDVWNALDKAFRHNHRVGLARQLSGKAAEDGLPPLLVFSFVDNTVPLLRDWGLFRTGDVAFATEILWQYRADPVAKKRIREILSDVKHHPKERIHAVRRALHLPEPKDGKGRPQ